jgi:hypothetical protein
MSGQQRRTEWNMCAELEAELQPWACGSTRRSKEHEEPAISRTVFRAASTAQLNPSEARSK